MTRRIYTQMLCKETGKEEDQLVVRESEDGIYLECVGCGLIRGYEIGRFAHLYASTESRGSDKGGSK